MAFPLPRRPAAAVLLALIIGVPLACSPAAPPPTPDVPPPIDNTPGFYADVTAATGIDVKYQNGQEAKRYAILESLGGGVAAFDFDGDGKIDLFFPGGGGFAGPDNKTITGLPPKLYRNLGGFKFEDVTAAAGLDKLADGQPWFYNHGVAVGDYDRDGFQDLLLTGYGRCALFHNEPGPNGTRRFREVTKAAGLLGPHFWSTSAAFGDLDGDGYPDLYLCQYVNWSNENDPKCPGYFDGVPRDVCSPKELGAVPHALFRNTGKGTFENVTAAAGLRTDRPDKDYGKGLGVLFVDVDLDGKPDIYVANDTTENFLYLNKSEPGKMKFEDKGMAMGVARDGTGGPNGSMGVDAADFEGLGRPSIWVANYENEMHALYRNSLINGRTAFSYYTSAAGLNAIPPVFVGFGTLFVDIDRDGWEDIVVNNGHVMQIHPKNMVKQPPVVFLNGTKDGRRYFYETTATAGPFFREAHRGRGLAVADLDNRGRQDLVFCNIQDPVRVQRHDGFADRNWVGFELLGKDKSDVTGARIVLDTNGRKATRFVVRGRSYLSHCDTRIVYGLGAEKTPGRATVYWPTGTPKTEHFDGLAAGAYHKLEQGRGRPE